MLAELGKQQALEDLESNPIYAKFHSLKIAFSKYNLQELTFEKIPFHLIK
jgi:hypothetical protein